MRRSRPRLLITILAILFILAYLLITSRADAATYYVKKTGSNSNSCTAAQNAATPKLTINAGIACMSGGDTVLVFAGTYDERITDVLPSGSAGAPTILRANGNAALGTGDSVQIKPTTGSGYTQVIHLASANYVTIDGFLLDGTNTFNLLIQFAGTSHHGVVQNCHVRNMEGRPEDANGGAGIGSDPNTTNITVQNNLVHDIGTLDAGSGSVHGIYLHGADHVIQDNISRNNSGYGIHVYAEGNEINNNTIIRRNLSYDNGATGILHASGNNGTIYNNIVYGNGFDSHGNANHGIYLYGNSVGSTVYNNSVYNTGGIAILIEGTNNIVRNNIVYGNTTNTINTSGATNPTVNSNLVTTTSPFVNAGAADFRLASGSAAIGAGANLSSLFTTDFLQSVRAATGPWDVGALVSGTSSPQPADQVAFGTQPVNTPVGGSIPAMTVRVENLLGGLITTATDTVTLGVAGTLIPQGSLSVVSVDSAETGYGSGLAIDGNPTTFWHTAYVSTQPPHPHQIIVSFPSSSVVGLTYRPRVDGETSGNIRQYEVYVSTDGSTWGTAVKTGTFTDEVKIHGLTWTPKMGAYLRLVALSEVLGGPYTNVGELNVLIASAVTPSGTLSHAASAGIATFSGISLPTPGTGYVLRATATGLTEGLSAPFDATQTSNPATKLAFGTPPATTEVNATIPTVTILIQDAGGATVTSSSASVTLVEQSVGATINGTLTRNAVNGVASFPGLSMPTVGTGYIFRATSSGLTLADSGTFNITAAGTVTRQTTFATQPATTEVDTTMASVTVEIEDLTGTLDTGATNSVTVALAGQLIPQGDLSVVSVDSEESGYGGALAINGNTTSFWHTEYVGSQPAHPHEIVINLGGSYNVVGLTYFPRDDAETSGNIISYEVYVSTDGSTWGTAVKTGSFTDEVKTHGLTWGAKTGSYLRLVALSEALEGPYTNVNELNVLAATSAVLSGTLTAAASSGVATFSTLSVDTVGVGYILSASAPGLLRGLSAPFTISAPAPPTIQAAFDTQPATTDADATMASVTVEIQDLDGALDTGATNGVTVALAGQLIPQGGISLVSVDSYETGYEGGLAIDGNSTTFWHTEFTGSQPAHPHEIVLDLGASYSVTGLLYETRAFIESSGNIKDYEVYVSTSSSSWGTAVKTGAFTIEKKTHGITWPAKVGRYLRLVALSEFYNDGPYASAMELNVLTTTSAVLSGTLTVAASSGIATFSTLSVNLPGSGYVLSAGGAGLRSGLSAPFTISAGAQPTLQVDFSTQPQDTLEDTTLSSFTVRVEDLEGTLQSSATTTIAVAIAGRLIPQTQLSVVSVDSAESGYAKEYALGGNTSLFWHTQWLASQPPHPHQIILSLGGSYSVVGLTYFPRDDAETSGNISAYAVYVSTDGSTWDTPVKTGILTSEVKTHGLTWTPKTGAYLRLVALSEVLGGPYTNANELHAVVATSATLSGTTSVAASSGVATFSTISVATPGDWYVLQATASGHRPNLSAPIRISVKPVALAFLTQPVSTPVNTAIPAFTVGIVSDTGALVPSASASVTLVEQTVGATVNGTLTVGTVNGVAMFSGLSLATTGQYRFRATATGLTLSDSSFFTISPPVEGGTLNPARNLRVAIP